MERSTLLTIHPERLDQQRFPVFSATKSHPRGNALLPPIFSARWESFLGHKSRTSVPERRAPRVSPPSSNAKSLPITPQSESNSGWGHRRAPSLPPDVLNQSMILPPGGVNAPAGPKSYMAFA